jgi:hypothetical protein
VNSQLIALAGPKIAGRLETYFGIVDEWAGGRNDLGLLSMEESIEQTNQFRSFHPLVRDLQGIVLDDPGTSDHHVSLCREPFKGAVMHLAHDGESRIVFEGIDSFLLAARYAAKGGGYVDDEHPKHAWMADDQTALKALIILLVSEPDSEDIVPALLPSLDLFDTGFLSTLVSADDLYVPEAVGREIAKRPASHLMVVAKLCEEHRHPMVHNAGTVARERIASL